MAEGVDPAFLFYPADASEDTQFLNRLERGCYFDLLKAQKKHRRFTIDLIRKVFGADFNACWPAVESVLKKDGDFYFIAWVDEAIEKRAAHAAKQKKRIKDYWDKKKQSETIPEPIQMYTTEQPEQECGNTLENENAIVNENVIEFKKEQIPKLQVFENIFSDDIFVEQLERTHRGKDLKQAFEECYTHHSNAPNILEFWEWRQKLNTWLSITRKNATPKNNKQSSRDLAAALQERINQDARNQQFQGSG